MECIFKHFRPKPRLKPVDLILQRLERIEEQMITQADIDSIKDKVTEQGTDLRNVLEEVKADLASHNDVDATALRDEIDANGQLVKDLQKVLSDAKTQPAPPVTGDSSGSDNSGDGQTGTESTI